MPLILGTNSIKDTGFDVANSLRFNDGSSDSLQQSTTAGTQTTWTFSFWIKRSTISSTQHIAENDLANYHRIRFTSGDVFEVFDSNGNNTWNWNGLFRDVSAWYHIVLRADSTDATNGNRLRLYVNGSLASANTVASISQNYSFSFNQGGTLYLGKRAGGEFFDGYMAEMVFIDGTSLDPTSFGEFDEDTNIWKPKDVSGLTFGSEGFYLDFENSGSLGADVSGNGNNFTVNNLTSIDQTTDTPTNNFATMNPLDNYYANFTFSDGNTTMATDSSGYTFSTSTIGVSSGKYYVEAKFVSGSKLLFGATGRLSTSTTDTLGDQQDEIGYENTGRLRLNGVNTDPWGSSYSSGDILSIGLDLDNNKVYFGKNGTWQNSADPSAGTGGVSITSASSTSLGNYFFTFTDSNSVGSSTVSYNFGSPAYAISSGNSDGNGYGNFEYAVPSGYYALNSKNLAEYG